MPTLTVRDIPEAVYDLLNERSERNRRSMSGEIVTILEQTLLPQPITYDRFLADAQEIHKRFEAPLPDRIQTGKRAGRRYDSSSDSRMHSDPL